MSSSYGFKSEYYSFSTRSFFTKFVFQSIIVCLLSSQVSLIIQTLGLLIINDQQWKYKLSLLELGMQLSESKDEPFKVMEGLGLGTFEVFNILDPGQAQINVNYNAYQLEQMPLQMGNA